MIVIDTTDKPSRIERKFATAMCGCAVMSPKPEKSIDRRAKFKLFQKHEPIVVSEMKKKYAVCQNDHLQGYGSSMGYG